MGSNDITKDKDGNIKLVGNEYNLLEWMKKNGCVVPYWHFSHEMFEDVDINEVKIQQLNGEYEFLDNSFILTYTHKQI